MPFLKIHYLTKLPDYQFNYLLIGDRQKTTVLFLHGFMGDRRDFVPAIDYFSEYCCLVPDLPGHGQTRVSHDKCYQMPQVALALVGLLDKLAIADCWLAGYSMGGRLALYLAVHFSQYFRGVILESASPGLKTPDERKLRIERDTELARRLESQDLARFIERWYANPLFDSFRQHPSYSRAIARRLDNNSQMLAKSLRFMGLGKQPSLWDFLPEIEPPILLIVGALDLKFVALNQKIAQICPQASLKVVENTGHNVHAEHSQQYVKSVVNFIERSNKTVDN